MELNEHFSDHKSWIEFAASEIKKNLLSQYEKVNHSHCICRQ